MRGLVFIAALCSFAAAPAMADHVGFSYGNLRAVFDGASSFTTRDWANTTGSVFRIEAPPDTAMLVPDDLAALLSLPTNWASGPQDLLISMTISDITATTADGSGSFAIKDIDGDAIAGNLTGTWIKTDGRGVFTGSLGNVTYAGGDSTFDGQFGSASMIFSAPQPWDGTLIQLTASGAWFSGATGAPHSFDVTGGSVDATVGAAVVPVPGAFLLGLIGAMGAAGLRRRKVV